MAMAADGTSRRRPPSVEPRSTGRSRLRISSTALLGWRWRRRPARRAARRGPSRPRARPASVSARATAASTPCSCDELGPLDERVDHLVLGHDGRRSALDEQVAALVAGGDAEVGLAGLARAVHDAAHDRDLERDLALAEGVHAPRLATSITSISARPHDGQAMRSTFLRSRRPSASSSWRPARASSTGSAVSE